MFSETVARGNVERIFDTYKVSTKDGMQLDVVVENYLATINQMQSELNELRDELAYHKKVHGEITDSLDEFFTIQRLSSIITRSLKYSQIESNLDDITQKIISHTSSGVFLREEDKYLPVSEVTNPDFELILNNMQEEGILDWLWERGQPIVVPLCDFAICDSLRLKTGNIVIAPMMDGQSGMGVYLLHTEKDHAQFSFRDLELLNILTQQAGIAMQYTRLYKKLENTHEALKKSQAKLMQTIKLATVGELAGGIAHEINNPLQIILGNVQMAMMGYKTEESLKIVESQAMRIANIVRGLLSMAKQKTVSSSEYLEINPLIMNTLNLVRGQIEKRGIKIETEMAEKLPVIRGSSIYFQQILLNFVLHAKKQIEHDGSLKIKSSLFGEKGIQIEIQDSGVPMPTQYIEKIMNPFDNIENSSEMNLGLTVSVQMIHDIGGEVKIESDPDYGNKVTIQLVQGINKEKEYDQSSLSTG